VDCGGITILLDPSSAQRADGLSIDFISRPDGAGFTIEHPNEPPRVRQVSATELKAMMGRGLSFELLDVRTEEERAIATIALRRSEYGEQVPARIVRCRPSTTSSRNRARGRARD